MPELPEVETVRRDLTSLLMGKTLTKPSLDEERLAFPSREELTRGIQGRQVLDIRRRGKYLIFTLSEGRALVVDLRMTGQLTVCTASDPPARHTHMRLPILNSGSELRFADIRKFGRLIYLEEIELEVFFEKRLGPEPFEISPLDLKERLRRRKAAIKTVLLNQKVIAGLGNIYADEVLFAARIRPTKRAGRITREEAARLCAAFRNVLDQAISSRGSTIRDFVGGTGLRGGFQNLHRVFRLAGKPCASCGTRVKMIRLSGRATHFCPSCQS